ncbi:MAG: periplasmic heavy metal sensor [Betaproteobacteria bacterium]
MIAFDAGKTSRAALLAAAFALAVGGNAALAQANAPAPETTHAMHARSAHGGDPLMGALLRLHTQLALNSSQQVQWDNAVAQSKDARAQAASLRQNAKAAYDAELAKDQPDLAAVAATADAARSQGGELQRSVRNAWLGVYANLAPGQKMMVRDALRERAADMADIRAAHHKRG